MKKDSILSLVSIAKKAGRIASGEFQTESAVKSGMAGLVFISTEASENTRKKFQNMCAYYAVPAYLYGTKEELGTATGSAYKAVAAVLDEGFAGALEKKLLAAGKRRLGE